MPDAVRNQLRTIAAGLDPVMLLKEIRASQQRLIEIADRTPVGGHAAPTEPTLEAFLSGLRTAWRDGEVRPTAQPKPKAKRGRRRPDPLVAVTERLRQWCQAEPWRTSRALLERLQAEVPAAYPDKLLRTLQRRVKHWRGEMAPRMVFGSEDGAPKHGRGEATGIAYETTGVSE